MLKTYFIFTLGCQMNVSDSERIEAVLEKCGLNPGDEKSADLIIVNACSVRQKPIDRIWGKLRVWQKINPQAKRILTGCVLSNDLKKLTTKFDFCFKIEDLKDFSWWVKKSLDPTNLDKKKNYLELKPKRLDKKIAYIPIMTGCNNFCSYCVVPYTRGKEWSRDLRAIVEEVRCLVKKGHKEIMLLGQNVCSYSCQQTAASRQLKANGFVGLLNQLVKIPGDFKISFMSPHPKDFSDELIDLIAEEPKISKQIHLPLQSGDDKVLQKMNRHYTTKEFLKLVDKMRNAIFDLEISTDIIVGFSGESKKEFQNTVNLAKKCRFNKAYVSVYSPRSGTMADKKFRDDVSMAEKKRRWLVLDQLINRQN
ncbi:MiaB/RimO family radical SAM methylthiotransferase [Patescibacteria group bacterium]|nr:MiaB/RimO family radical SAM methylthiotransferase [Patescibacteria group bacterium]